MAKNDELKKMNEDLLLSQRETLREVDELRVALQLANQGIQPQPERLFQLSIHQTLPFDSH